MGVAAVAPLVGLALVARPAMSAEPPENPPKSAAPKDSAPPKDVAPPKQQPRDAASPRDVAPRNDQPKDVAPRNDQPKDVAPRDNSPRPNAGKDARDVTPPPAAKNPPDNATNPRNPAPNARDDIPNARETKPNARETIPNARDSAPTARNTIPNARDANRDANRDTRDVNRDARDANRDTRDSRSTARDTRREHRSDRDLGITFGRMTDRGLAVSNLAETSALVRSGLRAGDAIVSINGHRLENSEDFDRYVYAVDNNERIKVIVFRDGREEVVYLEPTVFYADESYDDDYRYFGVVLDDRYPDRLIAVRVYPDSPAYLAGLRAGDEITTWHGQRVTSPREFGRLIHGIEPGNVDFEIARDSKTMRAQARFNERVATKPSTQTGPNSDERIRSTNPGPASGPSAPPSPAPGASPAPNPGAAPGPATTPPDVRPNPPATPGPAPAPTNPPQPRGPVKGLFRG